MACDPALLSPPRCRLRRLFTQPGVTVTGYGADDLVEVPPDAMFIIGRTTGANVRVVSEIGGHRTLAMFWRSPSWIFKVNNEWAVVALDDELLATFESRPVRHGTVIDVHRVHTIELVHSFRVELD